MSDLMGFSSLAWVCLTQIRRHYLHRGAKCFWLSAFEKDGVTKQEIRLAFDELIHTGLLVRKVAMICPKRRVSWSGPVEGLIPGNVESERAFVRGLNRATGDWEGESEEDIPSTFECWQCDGQAHQAETFAYQETWELTKEYETSLASYDLKRKALLYHVDTGNTVDQVVREAVEARDVDDIPGQLPMVPEEVRVIILDMIEDEILVEDVATSMLVVRAHHPKSVKRILEANKALEEADKPFFPHHREGDPAYAGRKMV